MDYIPVSGNSMSSSPWFTFVHCADLHLDSPFEGLHAMEPEIAGVLRRATFQAFDNIIDLAIREGADFLVVVGDVYDSAHRSLRAQIRFRESLRRAAEHGMQCFVAHGNHDPLSGWEADLTMPEGIHRFGGERVERCAARRGGETLAHLYGISYPTREVKENLIPKFPKEDHGPFAIGVLHGNVGGDPNHDNYAPCSLTDLMGCSLDYWALGHIHNAKILRQENPCVVYPGTPQGRSVREPEARGCFIVRVSPGGHPVPEFVATDVVRWFVEPVDIGNVRTLDGLLDELTRHKEDIRQRAAGRGAIWRLALTGRGELHALLRKLDLERELSQPLREEEAGRPEFVWLESTQLMTRPPLDLAQRRQVQDFIGDVLRAAESLRSDPNPEEMLHQVVSRRPEYRLLAPRLDKLSHGEWLALLDEAESRALDLLLEDEA
jgi:DNA repair exonuclease SbcCD nuclease subunit